MDIMSYLMGQNSTIKKGMKVEVVTELPETGEENVVYLVPKQSGSTGDLFDEYLYINNAWEHIGSANIDLSNYYTKSEIEDKEIIIDTNNTSSSYMKEIGQKILNAQLNNKLYIIKSTNGDIGKIVYYGSSRIIIEINETSVAPISFNTMYGISRSGAHYVFSYTINYNNSIVSSVSRSTRLIGNDIGENATQYPLATGNTQAFTPTANYHPATKKYVDDSIASAITDALGGEY